MTTLTFQGNVLKMDGIEKPLQFPIATAVGLTAVVAVLFDPDSNPSAFGQFPNIVGLDAKGNQAWTVELPTTTTGDRYFEMRADGERLFASSTTSFDVEIDVRSGKILSRVFFK